MFLSYSNQVLSIYKTILKTELPAELGNLTAQQIGLNAKLGEGCSFFASNGNIYSLSNPNLTAVNPVGNLDIASLSDSMSYLIEGNRIMKFSQQLNSYVPIYSIPGNGPLFGFRNAGNRFLVYSLNSVAFATAVPPYYSLDYTFAILVDNDWSVETVGSFTLSVQSNDPQVFIGLSAKLTKIYLQYTSPLTTSPTVILKNVDFSNFYISDVSFAELSKYQETIANLAVQALIQPAFLLDDQYLVVRNDTGQSTSTYVE